MSIGGSQYFISFIDDFTYHTWIYLIEKKNEVFSCFWDFKNLVEDKMKDQMFEIRWGKIILFRPVHELSTDEGNPTGVILHIHAGA